MTTAMHLVEVEEWHEARGVLDLLCHPVPSVILGCSDFYTVGENVRTEIDNYFLYFMLTSRKLKNKKNK